MPRAQCPPLAIRLHHSSTSSSRLLGLPTTAAQSHAVTLAAQRLETRRFEHEQMLLSISLRQNGETPRLNLNPSRAAALAAARLERSAQRSQRGYVDATVAVKPVKPVKPAALSTPKAAAVTKTKARASDKVKLEDRAIAWATKRAEEPSASKAAENVCELKFDFRDDGFVSVAFSFVDQLAAAVTIDTADRSAQRGQHGHAAATVAPTVKPVKPVKPAALSTPKAAAVTKTKARASDKVKLEDRAIAWTTKRAEEPSASKAAEDVCELKFDFRDDGFVSVAFSFVDQLAAAVTIDTADRGAIDGPAALNRAAEGYQLGYYESQQGSLCAVHAINNLLQTRAVTFQSLAAIADEQARLVGLPADAFYNTSGDFQKSVLSLALKQLGYRLADYVSDVCEHMDHLLSEEARRVVRSTQYAAPSETLPREVCDTHANFMRAKRASYLGCILASGTHYTAGLIVSTTSGLFIHVDSLAQRATHEQLEPRALLDAPARLEAVIHVLRDN